MSESKVFGTSFGITKKVLAYMILQRLYKTPEGGKLAILDYGCGAGDLAKYLKMMDNELDLDRIVLVGADYRLPPDGIEGYSKLIQLSPAIDSYERIVEDIKATHGKFDIIILSEVIEHMYSRDGVRWVEEFKHLGEYLMISTPSCIMNQFYDNNNYETHLSHWSPNSFTPLSHEYYLSCIGSGVFLIRSSMLIKNDKLFQFIPADKTRHDWACSPANSFGYFSKRERLLEPEFEEMFAYVCE